MSRLEGSKRYIDFIPTTSALLRSEFVRIETSRAQKKKKNTALGIVKLLRVGICMQHETT